MPFLVFTLTSVVTIPWAIYSQAGLALVPAVDLGQTPPQNEWAIRDSYLQTILPYLFSIIAGVWLIDSEGTTRWAAFWALGAAIGRLAVPLWIVTAPDVVGITGHHYIDWTTLQPILWFADLQMALVGVLFWAVFGHFAGSARGFHSAHEPAY
jgi:hypothetical protein